MLATTSATVRVMNLRPQQAPLGIGLSAPPPTLMCLHSLVVSFAYSILHGQLITPMLITVYRVRCALVYIYNIHVDVDMSIITKVEYIKLA